MEGSNILKFPGALFFFSAIYNIVRDGESRKNQLLHFIFLRIGDVPMKKAEAQGDYSLYLLGSRSLLLWSLPLLVCMLSLCWQKANASENITIALMYSVTGKAALPNDDLGKMVRLAIDDVNSRGGVLGRQLELVVFDTMSTPIGSAQAAQKAVTLGVSAVVGGIRSSHSLAMAPVLQKADIPMITPVSTNPQVTLVGDYIFRVCFLDHHQGRTMALFAREELGAQTTAVVTNIDEEYSIELGNYYRRSFEQAGGRVVAKLQYRADSTEFSTLLAELQQFDPDVVYLPGYSRDSGLFIKQARALGFSFTFLGGDAWEGITAYAEDAVDGSYLTVPWHPVVDQEMSRNLKERYFRLYGSTLDSFSSPLAYDAIMVLVEAMRMAGSTDGKRVRDALASIESYQGVTGEIGFDANGDPKGKQVIIIEFEDTRPTIVKILRS